MIDITQLTVDATVTGILPHCAVVLIRVDLIRPDIAQVTYRDPQGHTGQEIIYPDDSRRIEVMQAGRPWSFDGDGELFRLVSEAHRIRLAHVFDPNLAVHTSTVDPLPHQITAVYESMLPRQPLRFLLADDPGAGKTIMAGLLMKELYARGDLRRCLVICPGSLAEQWQDELDQKFQLSFEILTNDNLEASRTGNWFAEHDLVIARLDKLSRNEDVQNKLAAADCAWDLIVVDEAHKMSASFFGGEIKRTKRYQLGQKLSGLTRHFLLMTATPHNGKEESFQLFMALLDGDRFEGRFRDGVHTADVSDLMRRMVKEDLLKFDSTRLFPERIAETVTYQLSDAEAVLYRIVTDYVRQEFNRADALENGQRPTIGFALAILQRRLASSPEAIYQSLRRRRERLESKYREKTIFKQASQALSEEELEDWEDALEPEQEQVEHEVLDQATAARTLAELQQEINTLKRLEDQAAQVKASGQDTKWKELSEVLQTIFTPAGIKGVAEQPGHYLSGSIPPLKGSPSQKLIIFTEHRDTLNYLEAKISTLLGSPGAVVVIHGSKGREERLKIQEAFRNDPDVRVLIATDAAGEGINLQRAHLMINYDLPWNPNRLEQRFGRIHRIGQTEVCRLWNLVADQTREGDVYRRLLEKLEQARQSLGGKVFDVLGKLAFDGKPLKDLLIEAIRSDDRPEVKARLLEKVEGALDPAHLEDLLTQKALAHEVMDASRVFKIREDMERAEARRLQPHYIEAFFLKAFERLDGSIKQREPHRYQISRVPASIRNRDRQIGRSNPIVRQYERVVFEKTLIAPVGQVKADFVCPRHPLLDAVIDLTLEQHRDLLRRGSVLVDEEDLGQDPRVLFYLEHNIQDGSTTATGQRRIISKRLLYLERSAAGSLRHLHYAPYLDYRPLENGEASVSELLQRPECAWIQTSLEQEMERYAITTVGRQHLEEVKGRKLSQIAKTEAAVKERLTKEIAYWDHRAQELKLGEQAGKRNAKLNSAEARKRADELTTRLQGRMEELNQERQLSALPPRVIGGSLIIPVGLLHTIKGIPLFTMDPDRQAIAAKAREIVMQVERELGNEPIDRETEKLGYDIESRDLKSQRLRFIEVKGRVAGAETITVTKNEILCALNKPDTYILAIVEFAGDRHQVYYVWQPFQKSPDFGASSVNYNLSQLIERSFPPR